jgi:ABC-type sugar transport system permease subunit
MQSATEIKRQSLKGFEKFKFSTTLWWKKFGTPTLFLAPFLILMIIFIVMPVLISMYLSLTNFNMIMLYRPSRQTSTRSVVISRLGILRKRNRADACENAALFAHFSLPCLSSLYALTEARITSPFSAKPSLSLTGLTEIMSTKVFIFPKPIFTPSNPGRAATKG